MSAKVPDYVGFFSAMGAASAMIFSAFGAAYGTAKSGMGISAMAIMKPEMIMKSVIPVIMAGIIAIYGVVVAVLISQSAGTNITEGDASGDISKSIRTGFIGGLWDWVFWVPKFESFERGLFFEAYAKNWTPCFMHFGAGLAVGLSGLAAGFAIGVVGDAGVRGTAQQPKLYIGMILILIFAEVLGLYGAITALVMIYAK